MSDVDNHLSVGKLRRMSHVQLQSVAKKFQIKANLKTAKLRDAILDRLTKNGNFDGDADTSETPDESQMEDQQVLRRRTFDVLPCGESSLVVQAAVTPKTSSKTSSTDDDVYMTAHVTRKASDDDDTVFSSAKSKKATPRMMTPKTAEKTPIKTPKAKRDQSVGQTPPVRRIYDLRSNRTVAPNPKSMIPRPVKTTIKAATKTPNFARIHKKAFEKTESIDVTELKRQQRREAYKSRQKVTSGVRLPLNLAHGTVFKPTVLATNDMDLNFAGIKALVPPKTPKAIPPAACNASTLNRTLVGIAPKPVFDLAQSLAKKLRYKPYTGPLQPLSGNIQSDDISRGNIKISGHNVNTVKDKHRAESNTFLKGVRRNRRLDLQLKMRGVIE